MSEFEFVVCLRSSRACARGLCVCECVCARACLCVFVAITVEVGASKGTKERAYLLHMSSTSPASSTGRSTIMKPFTPASWQSAPSLSTPPLYLMNKARRKSEYSRRIHSISCKKEVSKHARLEAACRARSASSVVPHESKQ